MSNRRHPRQVIPLDSGPQRQRALPLPLQRIEWSDQPPAEYKPETLTWIAAKVREQNRLNAWRCEACDFPFIAFDRHPGTTPMMVSHHAFEPDTDCKGLCASVFYQRAGVERAAIDLGQGGQQIQPSHEWYRPSAIELRSETAAVKDHVRQGGLLVRPVAA
jgi:hypothetical protein